VSSGTNHGRNTPDTQNTYCNSHHQPDRYPLSPYHVHSLGSHTCPGRLDDHKADPDDELDKDHLVRAHVLVLVLVVLVLVVLVLVLVVLVPVLVVLVLVLALVVLVPVLVVLVPVLVVLVLVLVVQFVVGNGSVLLVQVIIVQDPSPRIGPRTQHLLYNGHTVVLGDKTGRFAQTRHK